MHLYEEYLKTLETASEIKKINIEDFQEKAYRYAEQYGRNRSARETFTYNITPNVEEFNAKQTIDSAEESINTIDRL